MHFRNDRRWHCLAMLIFGLLAASALRAEPAWTKSGLWYEVRGTGPAVLLLHGSNLDHQSMAALASALSAGHRVISADLRFHGASRDGSGPVSFVDDAAEVLDAAGVERATLIGHSMGAQIALDFALEHPQRVERLVLIGPSASGFAPSKPPPGLDEFIAALRSGDIEAAGKALAAAPVMHLVRNAGAQRGVTASVMRNLGLFRADRTRFRMAPAVADRLSSLKAPLLILVGEQDPTGALEVVDYLAAHVSAAQVDRIRNCGHLVPLDCPREAVDAIVAFEKNSSTPAEP